MPRRRSPDTMVKDAEAADLFRQGLSYRQIATRMGWRSPTSAVDAVRRAARDSIRDDTAGAEAFALMLDRIQDRRRIAYEALATPCYATSSSGKVVLHPDTDEPLIDIMPVFRAIQELRHEDDMEAKLRGLYAPAKSRVEVVTEDVVDAELKALAEEIAAHDRSGAGAS